MSWAGFDRLARGGGGADVTRQLRRGQQSRRLLLLRAFIDEVAGRPDLHGPLPEPDQAWGLLERAQQAAPAALDAVLMHPYTGSWLHHVRKLIHGDATTEHPLWTRVGHFHALAAAAAIRAGIDFDARIPAGSDGAPLPTLGVARLEAPEPWAVAEVRSRSGGVELSMPTGRIALPPNHTKDAPGWWGLRRLVARSDTHELAVTLDDLDPYRGLSPIPPRRVEPEDVKIWDELLQEAWDLIVRHLPDYAESIPLALTSVVPYSAAAVRNQSSSTSETFGSAMLQRPPDSASLAATVVHEVQHNLLYGLLGLFDLHTDDRRQRFYTLWRDDPRPIGGVLHGVYSFLGVTEFWRALARATDDPRARFEFAYWRAGTWETLQALSGDASLTRAGQRFVDGMAEKLEPWQDEPVPGEIADLAAAARADHLAGWRLRHIRPPDHAVRRIAAEWLAGGDHPGAPEPLNLEPVAESDGTWPGFRTDLLRLRIAGHEATPLESIVPDATEADLAYISGNTAAAIHGYENKLAEDPSDASAWVGLGLALSAAGDHARARPLLERPELVRAVYRDIGARTDTALAPDEFVAWWSRPAAE